VVELRTHDLGAAIEDLRLAIELSGHVPPPAPTTVDDERGWCMHPFSHPPGDGDNPGSSRSCFQCQEPDP
jgi:hypothetical protein